MLGLDRPHLEQLRSLIQQAVAAGVHRCGVRLHLVVRVEDEGEGAVSHRGPQGGVHGGVVAVPGEVAGDPLECRVGFRGQNDSHTVDGAVGAVELGLLHDQFLFHFSHDGSCGLLGMGS